MSEFTHFDSQGNAVMVDVSQKGKTERTAIAAGEVTMSPECYQAIRAGTVKKGDVLGVARISGIMATKQTSSLIPLCHSIPIEKVHIDFEFIDDECKIVANCTVKTTGKTGVEMEALTGVTVTLLTIYDMCKAVCKDMEIGNVCLKEKHGGKSGTYIKKYKRDK